MWKIFLVVFAGISVYLGMQLNAIFAVPPTPQLENTWWGAGEPKKMDESIKPFVINVDDKVLEDLKMRLKSARSLTPPLEGAKQHYGMNSKLLQEIVEFWQTRYDWRQREKFLNKFPQFTTNIQGLNIHFLRVKPENIPAGTKVIPLLLLHGWPGSVREFYDIIPILTTPKPSKNFVFEIIAPSLPGYGFSQGASKKGLGPAQMGLIFKSLMSRLGFKKFYIQGGDWGALIAHQMAALFPETISGVHSNMCATMAPPATLKRLIGSIYPPLVVEKEYEDRVYPLGKHFEMMLLELGYLHLQATKPDTVGVGLNDSPIGLAAYILEKFTSWTDPNWKDTDDGGLKNKFMYADLLDNVMIYWVTNSITTSVRLYSEAFNKAQMGMQIDRIPVTVPYACARFKYELAYQPDNMLTYTFKNLIYSSDFDDGGHFAAFELPKVLGEDVWKAVAKMESFYAEKTQKTL